MVGEDGSTELWRPTYIYLLFCVGLFSKDFDDSFVMVKLILCRCAIELMFLNPEILFCYLKPSFSFTVNHF